MAQIFHITTKEEWQKAQRTGEYISVSFSEEGFIHCSTKEQVADTANRLFSGRSNLVLLCINEDNIEADVIYENLEGGDEDFPHVYGEINLDAIVGAIDFKAGSDGRFRL